MANKTPSSHSGYFSELTASGGRQSNFLFPVRIKVTPNNLSRPLSDSKKNGTKMMQPVLIKDLFQSAQKDRRTSTLTSVSTQKKKARSQKVNQPFLNTQSCYKPKNREGEKSSLFDIQSSGGSKVRRQLYQTLDSPHKFGTESKENANKVSNPKKLPVKSLDETVSNKSQQDNPRKSFLLPPNTIKNTFIRRSGPDSKISAKQSTKVAPAANKNSKAVSQSAETKKQNDKSKIKTEAMTAKNQVSSDSADDKRRSAIARDKPIRKSTSHNRKTIANKVPTNTLGPVERPTVIMKNPTKKSSKSLNNSDDICVEMQNLSVDNSVTGVQKLNETQQVVEFDFAKIYSSDQNGLMQLRSILQQSLQACENQALQLKKAIECIDALTEKSKSEAETSDAALDNQNDEIGKAAEKCNLSYTISVNDENSSPINKSSNANEDEDCGDDDERTEIIKTVPNVSLTEEKTQEVEKPETKPEQKLPIPITVLISEANSEKESNEASMEIVSDATRLSTIGEVSCELSSDVTDLKREEKDSAKKDKSSQHLILGSIDNENKENVQDCASRIPCTPKTPRARRRSATIADNCYSPRRRSARLAAKSMSQSMLSDSDRQDSFTLLENELNVVHKPPPSKSLPASPMKPPMTPATIKQFERPLKEYMALKMNGSFLVTPDVKRFQSHLEPTDTPHSRKSLSRKIFMELCDLYADSPEHR